MALVGRVIRMEDERGKVLAADARRPKGTRVVLISGTTTRELVGMPNVKGLTLEEARTALLEAKLVWACWNLLNRWKTPATGSCESARATPAAVTRQGRTGWN